MHEQLIEAAKQGDPGLQCLLGLNYAFGKDAPQDFKQAAFWLTKAAEQGEKIAQYNLGAIFENGFCVPKDDNKAAYWYAKSAAQGDAAANKLLNKLSKKQSGSGFLAKLFGG